MKVLYRRILDFVIVIKKQFTPSTLGSNVHYKMYIVLLQSKELNQLNSKRFGNKVILRVGQFVYKPLTIRCINKKRKYL